MEETLQQLLEVEGVLGVVLVSQDGLPIAAINMDETEAETVGALTSAMIGGVRSTTDRLAFGDLEVTQLRTGIGCLRVHSAGELLLLILHEHEVDQHTLDSTVPHVVEHCREFAA